ncbi:MAG TPA: hypothetical protein VJO33_17285 [Gemmatimonadaceae bacterium]|nr:hypothetical protein [Gemmatimonadaceae bacterium]
MPDDSLHQPAPTPSLEVDALKAHLGIEDSGTILIVRVDGGPHGFFGPEIANQLEELVNRVDHGRRVHAVVVTGAHPKRFISHADVRWLQERGELPLYDPDMYARTLESGRVPGRHSTDAVSPR